MANADITRDTVINLQVAAREVAEAEMQMLTKDVKLIRVYGDMSQEEFAAYLGVSRQCLTSWELGTRKPPLVTARIIQLIASGIKKMLSS